MDLDFLTVVEGFLFDKTHNNPLGHPYVDVSHPHDFLITDRTYHTHDKRLLRTCTVMTSRGKRHLVITGVFHISDPVAKIIVSHLGPVINFHENGIGNTGATRAVIQHSRVQQRIDAREKASV